MATFTLVGTSEPFLHVAMTRGDKIYCESNAMVMMEDTLELKGKLQGGLAQSLLRRFANDESLFQQHIEAVYGDGDCLLAPMLDGDMMVLDVGPAQYTMADGAFVAASDQVEVKVKLQGLGGALFGETGGFMVMHTKGQGKLAISGFGSLFEVEVTPEKPVIIDNGHVVCWDSRLEYNLSASTARNSGLVSTLFNSQTSGEGMVLRFKGQGKVVVCSRNRTGFLAWLKNKFVPGS